MCQLPRPAERAAGLITFDDPVLWSHRKQVVALATKRRLPVMYGYREFVDDGGLMSYGPDRVDHYRRTALYVDKILRGAKPADLPVEQPTKFELDQREDRESSRAHDPAVAPAASEPARRMMAQTESRAWQESYDRGPEGLSA